MILLLLILVICFSAAWYIAGVADKPRIEAARAPLALKEYSHEDFERDFGRDPRVDYAALAADEHELFEGDHKGNQNIIDACVICTPRGITISPYGLVEGVRVGGAITNTPATPLYRQPSPKRMSVQHIPVGELTSEMIAAMTPADYAANRERIMAELIGEARKQELAKIEEDKRIWEPNAAAAIEHMRRDPAWHEQVAEQTYADMYSAAEKKKRWIEEQIRKDNSAKAAQQMQELSGGADYEKYKREQKHIQDVVSSTEYD